MSMQSHKKGFTLLETLVAVSLLMIAIVGPLTIAQKSVKTSSYTKNRVTAYYLAQDALEFLRNIRDTNSLRGFDWNRLLLAYSACLEGVGSGKCDIESLNSPDTVVLNPGTSQSTGNIILFPCAVTCPNLTFFSSFGYYGHLPGTESQFRREITITPLNTSPDNRELLIRVDVIWNESILGGEKKISLYDEVYDWQ